MRGLHALVLGGLVVVVAIVGWSLANGTPRPDERVRYTKTLLAAVHLYAHIEIESGATLQSPFLQELKDRKKSRSEDGVSELVPASELHLELPERAIADDGFVVDPWGGHVRLKVQAGVLTSWSAGPDGRVDTPDDLVNDIAQSLPDRDNSSQ